MLPVMLAMLMASGSLGAAPAAAHGTITVQDADLKATVALDGEWQFMWGRLVSPAELASSPAPAAESIRVPGFWTDKAYGYPAVGNATYRLIVELPEKPAEPLGLSLTQISTAYRVYANGVLLAENGKVSDNAVYSRGVLAPRTVFISAAGRLDLVIQVSNADDVTAGVNAAPVLGYQSVIAPLQERSTLIEGLIYAAILIMGLYHILLSILQPSERASLFFGLLALDIALRGLLTGTRIIHQFFGAAGFHTLIAIEYITVYAAGLLVYLYFYYLFPNERPKFARIPLMVITGALCLFVVVAPISVITPVHFYYEFLLLALGVLVLVWLVRAIVAHRDGSVLMLVGFLVMLGGAVYDIVQDMLDSGLFFVSSYAMFVFVFVQAVLIARRYAGAFKSVEAHSRENHAMATAYGRFVPREFLSLLGKDSITSVELGDQIEMEMTVLFADIRSFTTLSEKMGPRENFNFLNSYLKRISPVIRNNRGFIDKYLGDGIMALFPRSPDDALRASADMMSTMREYNMHRARSGYSPISIGMGINTGNLMLGTIGETSRMEGTVISDVVNLASRLETLTRPFNVPAIMSGEVLASCPQTAGLSVRYLGRARVKGKTRAVSLYEIIDPAAQAKLLSRATFERAVGHFEARRYAQALTDFNSVLQADPSDGPARYYLGKLAEPSRQGEEV
jgi:adenylate cyclase